MWPFRKKHREREARDRMVAETLRRGDQWIAEQQADMQRRLDEQIARIAATPMPAIFWTPVMNGYGQIVALAWKNDAETALRLLEQPAEGRA